MTDEFQDAMPEPQPGDIITVELSGGPQDGHKIQRKVPCSRIIIGGSQPLTKRERLNTKFPMYFQRDDAAVADFEGWMTVGEAKNLANSRYGDE